MPAQYESPRFLLTQTSENLDEFNIICKALFEGDCSSNVIDVDPETGNKTYKLKFNRTIPGKARHIAATAVNDLRHSLDQSASEAFRIVTGANPPDKLYFPFATNPNDLAGRLGKYFPPELHSVFSSFEPYPTGQGYSGGNDLLCNLSTAAGPNKHQITCKVGGRIVNFRAESIRATKCIHIGLPPIWDIDNNELIVGITPPDGHIDYHFQMAFYIALANAGAMSDYPASAALRKLTSICGRIVDGLEGETARIVRERS